tara:strand:- start:221 stop:586 length:366 start_codon:yes stop_codon:yes gene_type:complete
MTKQEKHGIRDIKFSQWIRKSLPDSSTGFSVSDIDFMLWNWKTKRFALLEIKCRNVEIGKGQKIMLQNIHRWIKNGLDNGWKYHGYHLVTFEGDTFENGKVYLNKKETTEKDLIDFLSLEI